MTAIETDSPKAKFPPPLLFATGLAAGWMIGLPLPTTVLPTDTAHLIGGVILGCGALLAASALHLFFSAKTSIRPDRPANMLVIRGPYRFTRNPMYLSMALLYLGFAALWQLAWALLLLPVVLFLIERQVIVREEEYLARRFGSVYEKYKAQVRRWI